MKNTEILSRVNADDIIHRIREWRKGNGLQSGTVHTAQQVHDHNTSSTVLESRKKKKTSQSVASLSLGAPSPAVHPSMQPSSSALKHEPPSGTKTTKQKSKKPIDLCILNDVHTVPFYRTYKPKPGSGGSSGAFAAKGPAEGASYDPWIGRKVWTRWPEDHHFYEAGLHALVYDMNSANETWEWVNLKEISPEDIRWEGQDPGISGKGGRPGPGRGLKKSMPHGGAVTGSGRGRGMMKVQPKKDFTLSQQGAGRRLQMILRYSIQIPLSRRMEPKQVEKVFTASHPDPMEMEKAKKMLKEDEQALVNAITRLGDVSEGESDVEPPFSQDQSMDQEKHWKKQQYNSSGVRVPDGSNGDKLPRETSAPSEYPHEVGNKA
ncbi:hypothetical protein JHK86_048975 [Glycine max]|nr:hypothetical protein JHK86_048975 [Glycine max]